MESGGSHSLLPPGKPASLLGISFTSHVLLYFLGTWRSLYSISYLMRNIKFEKSRNLCFKYYQTIWALYDQATRSISTG